MAINKVFIKTRILNYLISSGMLFANTINVHRISAATQENIDIQTVVLTDLHHVVVAKNGSII